MYNLKRTLSQFGFDGWAFMLCGVGAIVIAVLDFAQIIRLTTEEALRMIIVAIGLIMGAIAAQAGKRSSDLRELRDSLGTTSVELVSGDPHIRQSILSAKHFVLDTTLHLTRANMTHPADNPNHYYFTLYQRLERKEITYRKVETIPNKERLAYVISRLLIFEGMDYLVRYYDSLPKPIPALNVVSIDNESFYLGAFYSSDAPVETATDVFIRSPELGRLLEMYWENLWHSAKPLNEAKRTDWDELKAIARRVGMSEEEFDSVVKKWKEETQRRRRRPR